MPSAYQLPSAYLVHDYQKDDYLAILIPYLHTLPHCPGSSLFMPVGSFSNINGYILIWFYLLIIINCNNYLSDFVSHRVQWKNTQKCRFIFKKPLVYKPLRDFIIFRVLKNLLFSKKIGRV